MLGKIRFSCSVMILGMLGAALLLCFSSWAQKAKPPKPPSPPPDPAIAYVEEKSWGHTNLAVMNDDGSNKVVLLKDVTGAGYGNHDPNWSPDGNWIVFGRTDGGTAPQENGIYLINKDGTGLCKVVATDQVPCWGLGGAPKWSPIEPVIIYTDWIPFLADATCPTNTVRNLSEYHWSSPTWAPDLVRLAVITEDPPGDGDTDIVVFDLEQEPSHGWIVKSMNNLTEIGALANAFIVDIDWARQTDTLAVAASFPDEDYDIWVLDMDNPANPINITNTPEISEREPSWSPFDTQIVFRRNDSICLMDAYGSNIKSLAVSASNVRLRSPDWRRNF